MKRLSLLMLIFIATSASAFTLPKKILGQYDAEIPPFQFEEDGEIIQASGYTVSILLRETYMWYRAGNMKFRGSYESVVEDGALVDIKVNVSNKSSVAFPLEMIVNKKTKSLILKGLKGVNQVKLDKKEDKPEKNRGFTRL